MAARPRRRFLAGAAVALLDTSLFVLARVQDYDFLKTNAPWLYSILISPITFSILLLLAISLILKGLSNKQNISNVVPKQNKTPQQVNTGSGRPLKPVRRERSPILTPAPPIHRANIPIPILDQRDNVQDFDLPGQVLPIRNKALDPFNEAINLIAVLHYTSHLGQEVIINSGWWCESYSDGTGNAEFSLGRSETAHLVLSSVCFDGGVAVFGKVWKSFYHRYLPLDIKYLVPGDWTLVIDLEANDYRLTLTLTASIEKDCETVDWKLLPEKELAQRG